MTSESSLLSYRQSSSFIHKLPAELKILFIPVINLLCFYLDYRFSIIMIILQFLLSCFLKISIRDQLKDLKPVLFYAIFLIIIKITGYVSLNINEHLNFISFISSEKETGILLLKLLCIMQSASVFFKTSSPLQIKQGLKNIELFIRHPIRFIKNKNELTCHTTLSDTISAFICCIPMVAKNWKSLCLSWKARGGKKNIRMLCVLLPVFFSTGLKQAYNHARAVTIRQ